MNLAHAKQRAEQWGKGHADTLTNVAFCLTASEIFLIYRNFRTPEVGLGRYGVPMLGSLIATIFALLVCCAMLASYMAAGKRVRKNSTLFAAALCASAASLAQLFVGHGLEQGWVSVPCVALSSFGCACFVPELVRRMAGLGVTNMVRCCAYSCLVLLFVAPLSNVLPFGVFALVMCLVPLAMLACFLLGGPDAPKGKRSAVASDASDGQKLPRILLLTILLGSLMEGVVAGLDEASMDWQGKLAVFSLAFVASAIVIRLTLLQWNGSYNSAIFRQCIPVMAGGIAIFVVGGTAALNIGSFVFLIGRQMFITVVMALVVYLIRYHESDYYLLSLGVMLGATLGSLAGQLLYRFFEASNGDELLCPTFIVMLLFFVFVCAMYLSDATNVKTHWGMIAIDDSHEAAGSLHEQAYRVVASSYGLTPREQEIMAELACDQSRQAIAAKLFISEGTVKVHARNLYQKLGIHSKRELRALLDEVEAKAKDE